MISFVKKHLFVFIGVFFGGITGFLYYKFIGCASGTCAITSKPLNSSIYGMIMGGLLFDMIKGFRKK
jgi:phage shock protein E